MLNRLASLLMIGKMILKGNRRVQFLKLLGALPSRRQNMLRITFLQQEMSMLMELYKLVLLWQRIKLMLIPTLQ